MLELSTKVSRYNLHCGEDNLKIICLANGLPDYELLSLPRGLICQSAKQHHCTPYLNEAS